MKRWLIAFNCGNAADIITTYYGLALGGREANPIVNYAITHWGFATAAAIKISLGILATVLLYHRMSEKTCKFLTTIIWLVVLNNLAHILWRLYASMGK